MIVEKRFTFIFFLISVLCAINCSKDETSDSDSKEEPKPEEPRQETEIYFALNTESPPNLTEASDDWVILHDVNGNLLGYSAYETGDKLEFDAPIDVLTPTIAVTYLNYRTTNGNQYFEISTTVAVNKGSIENIGPNPPPENPDYTKTGEFNLSIQDIPDPFRNASPTKVELSSGRGRLGFSSGGTGLPNGTLELNLQIESYQGFDDYLISILDGNNHLKYFYLNNSEVQNLSANYITDFLDFEKEIGISLPPHTRFNLNIAGFKEDQDFSQYGGYWLHDVISVLNRDVVTNPLKIGYLDMFNKYRTLFNINMDGYDYGISHYGKALDTLVIPEKPVMNVVDRSLNAFSFDIDLDFIDALHKWDYQEGSSGDGNYIQTRWSLSVPKDFSPSIGELPDEILEKYPDINVERMEYRSSSFNLPMENPEFLSNHQITIFEP
ncbi:hypothetical protein [Ulvibacterium sp.]|uniref:hypothetical protein n=1 Tax=Ulvibacterium sp. TaxID=2665914 RepID=UPI003BAC16CA